MFLDKGADPMNETYIITWKYILNFTIHAASHGEVNEYTGAQRAQK